MTDTLDTNVEWADRLAGSLPTCEPTPPNPLDNDEDLDPDEGNLISLCDIVVTAIDCDLHHFKVTEYDSSAGGIDRPWATLWPLREGSGWRPIQLTAFVMRKAVYDYLISRLNRGMAREEVAKMVDGSYTDELVADCILQFALYGGEVYT